MAAAHMTECGSCRTLLTKDRVELPRLCPTNETGDLVGKKKLLRVAVFHTKFSESYDLIAQFRNFKYTYQSQDKSAPQSCDFLHVHGHFEPLAHVAVHCRWHPETVALYIIFI